MLVWCVMEAMLVSGVYGRWSRLRSVWFGPRSLRGLPLITAFLCRFLFFESVRKAEGVCGPELDGKLYIVIVGDERLWVVYACATVLVFVCLLMSESGVGVT